MLLAVFHVLKKWGYLTLVSKELGGF